MNYWRDDEEDNGTYKHKERELLFFHDLVKLDNIWMITSAGAEMDPCLVLLHTPIVIILRCAKHLYSEQLRGLADQSTLKALHHRVSRVESAVPRTSKVSGGTLTPKIDRAPSSRVDVRSKTDASSLDFGASQVIERILSDLAFCATHMTRSCRCWRLRGNLGAHRNGSYLSQASPFCALS